MTTTIKKLADSKKLLNRAKEIIQYDIIHENENMDKNTQNELTEIARKLVEIAIYKLASAIDNESVFWSYVLLSMPRKFDLTFAGAMAVYYEPEKLTYVLLVNPYITLNLVSNIDEVKAIVNHEGYHVLYNHINVYNDIFKTQPELIELLNIATDCEINQHLTNLPDGCVTLEYVNELCAEKLDPLAGSKYYFDKLFEKQNNDSGSTENESKNKSDNEKENDNQQQNNNSQKLQKDDGVTREHNNSQRHQVWAKNEFSQNEAKQVAAEMMSSAQKQVEKSRGTLSTDILEQIQLLKRPPQLTWKQMYSKSRGKIKFNKKKTPTRLNRRQPQRLDKKGSIYDKVTMSYVAFDTSGSIATKDLEYMLNEVKYLQKKHKSPFNLIQFDSEIKNIQEVKSQTGLNTLNVKGRGGTAFQPVFDYLKELNEDKTVPVIIFTDGYGEDKVSQHGFNNVTWVIVDYYPKSQQLSCGETCYGKIALVDTNA